MSTYKDDLDILKAAEKADTNKLTFNAITELDNKGLLGRYGNEGGGTGGGAMVATATQSGAYVTLDKTWKELADAMESGIVPVILYNDGTNKYKETVTMINQTSDLYSVSTTSFTFEVDTETGYPSFYAD